MQKIIIFIKQAFSSIIANKMRSILSTLGIIIGISSFVIMLSVGEGAKNSIMKDFGNNSKLITVDKKGGYTIAQNIFTPEVIEEIPKVVPMIDKAFPNYSGLSLMANYKEKNVETGFSVIDKGYLKYEKNEIIKGSFFTDDDYKNNNKVVILGDYVANKGVKGGIKLGKEIIIGGEKFLVSGILKKKNYNFDYNIFIPNTTAAKVFNQREISGIKIYTTNEKKMKSIKNALNYYLFKKSVVEKAKQVNYKIKTDADAIKQINQFTGKFTMLLGGIGAIALVVGGIGIMNIMLVSVTERTREIGIRKAIGATNGTILSQFLTESIILTLIGTFFAILLSYGVTSLITSLVPNMQVSINASVLSISISVAFAMGLIFGLMPAWKAAKLKPIDALHFE
ncbi:MAG: ABC transporter permease [Candidatus Gracilibacteria bacterium]|nr:ABC transporter permease [Candidatus Gracilibacteria bacterium]